eukprot:JP438783.1.p1 GENE.JP438783.1~~JP438783.1.p1  ORF type:complete len:103 (+),score=27.00 JP438783.1:1-309(+)
MGDAVMAMVSKVCSAVPTTQEATLRFISGHHFVTVLAPLSDPALRTLLSLQRTNLLQTFLENLEEDTVHWAGELQKGRQLSTRTLKKLTHRYQKLSRMSVCA